MNDKIDIVLPWVDGSDPEWIKEKERCRAALSGDMDEKTNSNIRFQDWDNLKYWFRAAEKFLPWVNRIFLVTWGHLPRFLNIKHPKIKILKHSDYIPEEYLPTFNSNTIEMNLHRIRELEDNFILFNDDTFPLQPVRESYYFKNNMVCDEAVEGHITPIDIGDLSRWARYVQANNVLIINRHFKKREVQKRDFWKWFYPGYGELLKRNISLHYWYDFSGFHDPHMANPMKKSTLAHLWEVEEEELHISSLNHFRNYTDISQYLIRYWQLCTGKFNPRRIQGKSHLVTIHNYKEIAKGIAERKWQMVSLNENCTPDEFEIIKEEINKAFEKILPDKSEFEK